MTHRCDYCGREYDTIGGLNRHICTVHSGVVEDALADAKPYTDTRMAGGFDG
ncbi:MULTISPECIES: hypothetical protein [Salinibaculum]|uniref:hypothetical protein n=1 Tax=Salinibaculum TaxID=2732368 RepID=UPI0030D5FC4D